MEQFINFITNETFLQVLGALSPLFVFLVGLLCSTIASKVKNEKLKRLFQLVPEAMIFAEKNAVGAEEKLSVAVEYLLSRIKGVNKQTIVNAIETVIPATKQVNVSSTSKTSVHSISTRR